MNASAWLIAEFINEYDSGEDRLVKEQSIECEDLGVSWVQTISATIINWWGINNWIENNLLVQRVSWIEGSSPIFTLKWLQTKESKALIGKVTGMLKNILYIPNDRVTTEYAKYEILSSESIDRAIERFWQTIAWYIKNWNFNNWEKDFLASFTTIRRRLQKERKMGEMETYIYIYWILAPYIWVSTFLALQKKFSRNPTHEELYNAVRDYNVFTDELNRAFNELSPSEKSNDEFFFIRDAILLGCSNRNIDWVIYPFSK